MAPLKDTFKVGDTILAKWPGSSLYYDAEVLSVGKSDVQVRFSEGTEETLPFKFVSAKKSERGRPKSPGRPKSSTKSKSPARSPGRRRSPARGRSKSPTRRSRATRSSSRTRQTKKREPSRSLSPEREPEKKENEKSNNTVRKRKETVEEKVSEVTSNSRPVRLTPTRSSSRLAAQFQKPEHIEEVDTNSKTKKILDFPTVSTKPEKYGFFGHFFTHIMIFLLPFLFILMYLACSKKHCSLTVFPKIPSSFSIYFAKETVGLYLAGFFSIFILNCIPIGKIHSTSQDGLTLLYRCNGFGILVASLVIVGALEYFGMPASYLHKKFFKMMSASIAVSFVMSLALYAKSFWAKKSHLSVKGNTGCWPTDFFNGRENDPRFGRTFDIKQFLFRVGFVGWAIVVFGLLSKEHAVHKGNMNPSLVLSCAMQLIYISIALYNEDFLLTAGVRKESLGFCNVLTIMSYIPFVFTTPSLYILNYRPVLPIWSLVCISLVFFLGLYILNQSNIQKHRFRMNPFDPRVAHLETIMTSRGKKLLVSGWWGWVCHPNYLGDLLTNLAFSLPAGFAHGFPFLIPAFTTLLLVYKAYSDDADCKQRYGSAWEKYRERVKYRLVPYIY